jgi:hypothetical protein
VSRQWSIEPPSRLNTNVASPLTDDSSLDQSSRHRSQRSTNRINGNLHEHTDTVRWRWIVTVGGQVWCTTDSTNCTFSPMAMLVVENYKYLQSAHWRHKTHPNLLHIRCNLSSLSNPFLRRIRSIWVWETYRLVHLRVLVILIRVFILTHPFSLIVKWGKRFQFFVWRSLEDLVALR